MAHGVANVTLCYAEQWVLFSGSRGRSPVWVWCEADKYAESQCRCSQYDTNR